MASNSPDPIITKIPGQFPLWDNNALESTTIKRTK